MGSLTISERRKLLRRLQLGRDDAAELAGKFHLGPDGDGRSPESYVNALARSEIDIVRVLYATYVDDLKTACGEVGLDPIGRKKDLIERLLSHFGRESATSSSTSSAKKIFIGHGRSHAW